jgi:hypothetical protein
MFCVHEWDMVKKLFCVGRIEESRDQEEKGGVGVGVALFRSMGSEG